MLRKIFYIFLAVGILTLDWAALHDILKNESNVLAEYLVLIFSFILLIIFGVKRKFNLKIILGLLFSSIISAVLHNLIYGLTKFEEPLFFTLTLILFLGFLVSLFQNVYKNS